jgi:hypothetical protein
VNELQAESPTASSSASAGVSQRMRRSRVIPNPCHVYGRAPNERTW